MPKIYIWCNDCGDHGHCLVAIAEDGVVLAGLWGACHADRDILLGERSDPLFPQLDRTDSYRGHYPDGYELIWVDNGHPGMHAGLDAAVARNRQRFAIDLREPT